MNKQASKFSPEVRARAVCLVREQRSEHPSMLDFSLFCPRDAVSPSLPLSRVAPPDPTPSARPAAAARETPSPSASRCAAARCR
ncbi:hypothetical protein DCN14_13265 [Burkholderia sp. IDO3]|nr:hypothetical protein DCN14_13265 [Burkholderia sp. IDO3]